MKKLFKRSFVTKVIVAALTAVVTFSLVSSEPIETMAFPSRAECERTEELIFKYGMSFEEASDHMEKEGWFSGGEITLIEPGTSTPSQKPETKPQPPACSHDWASEVTKEPSCAEEGSLTKTCNKCGESKTEVLKKTEHDYTLTEHIPGDCTNKELKVFVCEVCGDKYTEEGAKGEHAYIRSEDSMDASCEESGTLVMVCAVCGDSYTEEVEALGHDFPAEKSVLEMPTCVKDGKAAFQCSRCGFLAEEEVLPATGHKKSDITKVDTQATFWKDGANYFFCTECGETLDVVTVPATGGIWRKVIPVGSILLAMTLGVAVIIRKLKKK